MLRLSRPTQANFLDGMCPLFEFARNLTGLPPNDVYDMARNPIKVDAGLKRLIGYIATYAANCKHYQVDTAQGANEQRVHDAKMLEAREYEMSFLNHRNTITATALEDMRLNYAKNAEVVAR